MKNYIDNNRENIVSDLKGLVQIPSISADKENVGKALNYVLDLARSMGFDAKAVCDHQVGVIEIGQGEETVGILTHVDVVPPGDLKNWNYDPFQLTVENGRLYGRGTMDDKGPMIVCLYAMKAVFDSGKPFHKRIQMIIGTQEEVEWVDMNRYVKEYPLPDFGFTPDGEFPLCNIEKGIGDVELQFPISRGVIEDGWYLTNLDAGEAENSVPGSCSAEIARFVNGIEVEKKQLSAKGKSVHSCQPEKGINAIFSMAEELEKHNLKKNDLLDLLKMTVERFSSIYGKELGLYSESETYNGEFVHRNVFAPTLFKTEKNQVVIHVNVRFAYGTEAEEIVQIFRHLAKEYGGRLDKAETLPAVYVSKDMPFMKPFCQAYEEGSGRNHEFVLAYGGSYAKAMPNIVSWGPIFPEDEDTCHEDNEYISIKSLMDSGKVFALALEKVALLEEDKSTFDIKPQK